MLSEEAKKYIKYDQELLEEDKFQEFFNNCGWSNRCEIAEFFLLDCNINFLEYMAKIPEHLFYNGARLKNINIPNSVIKIGNRAFYGCESLQSTVIPDSVTEIDNCAFGNCKSLQSITIPDSVIKINYYVFYNCTSLKEIKLPKHLKEKIDLKKIDIDENQTKVIWY